MQDAVFSGKELKDTLHYNREYFMKLCTHFQNKTICIFLSVGEKLFKYIYSILKENDTSNNIIFKTSTDKTEWICLIHGKHTTHLYLFGFEERFHLHEM